MDTENVSVPPSSELQIDLVDYIGREVAVDAVPIGPDTDLVMSGIVDSLGVMMIVEWLERRLEIAIDPNDVVIEHFGSIRAITDYLRTRDDCGVG